MKRINIKPFVAAVGLLVCSIAGVVKVFAEGENSSTLIVSPMTQKIILTPGEVTRGSIQVSNPNDAKMNLEYSVSIGSFSQKKDESSVDDYGTVDTDVVSNYNMMMDWISLDKDSGVVEPNNTDTIWYTITVPEDAPAGGQYATILVKDDTKRANEGNGNVSIQSISQMASIIYAEVAGETRDDGQVVQNDVPGLVLSNPLTATSMVKNDGNVHTNATYTLQVWPMFGGDEICTNEENPSESLVMPETTKYHAEECNLPSIGLFRAKQTIKIFGEESVVEKVVVMCPIWLMFVALAIIVALIIWITMRVRARSKKNNAKTK